MRLGTRGSSHRGAELSVVNCKGQTGTHNTHLASIIYLYNSNAGFSKMTQFFVVFFGTEKKNTISVHECSLNGAKGINDATPRVLQ